MKNISDNKTKLHILYAKKHCNIFPNQCKKKHCVCSIAAELKAYIDAIIPYPYNNYTIHDFNGKVVGKNSKIPDYIFKKAKNKLLQYCWKDLSLEEVENKSLQEINKKSIIQTRYKQCKNLVIYSDDVQISGEQSGKTMIAGLVLKEAIKSRIDSAFNFQTYDWIQYSTLKDKLVNDPDSLSNTKLADWLVVDDITNDTLASKNQKLFLSSKLDPFFNERIESNLPTIFVFRFDIKVNLSLFEEAFGVSMSKMAMNQFTHKIDLTI